MDAAFKDGRFEGAAETYPRGLPPWTYANAALTKLEHQRVLLPSWQIVCHINDIPHAGDYHKFDLGPESVVVLRDKSGTIRAYHNVCRHRAARLLEGTGNCGGAITCPYHGWTYNLDGSLRAAPAMDLNEGFCKDDYKLPSIRCEEWLGWVMVTLDADAAPVAERLSQARALIDDFQMETYVESFRETHVWNTNWKILAENFMESYHLPVCHSGTIGGLSRLEDMICPPGQRAFNYHTILKDDTLKIALAHPDNTRLKGDRRRTTFLLAIYPSLLITLTPGYFWYLSLHPRGPGRVNIVFGGGMSPDFAHSPEAQAHFAQLKTLLDKVNVEDRGCTEKVFQGLSSGLATPGHLSHLERPNFDFAQYLAERTGGFTRSVV